jgi:hypothetical protein
VSATNGDNLHCHVGWLPMSREKRLPHKTPVRGPHGERGFTDAWNFAGRGVYIYHVRRGKPHGRLLEWGELSRWKFRSPNNGVTGKSAR